MPRIGLSRRAAVHLAAGALLCAALLPAAYAEPRFGELIISAEKNANESDDAFEADTAKIYVTAQLVEVPAGNAKVTATWIAVATKAAPPNYVIVSSDIAVNGKQNVANFALSKPDGGWPLGSYRVDLAMNGKRLSSVKFKVE